MSVYLDLTMSLVLTMLLLEGWSSPREMDG